MDLLLSPTITQVTVIFVFPASYMLFHNTEFPHYDKGYGFFSMLSYY